jgi:HAD superfamily hydrolase (TIGR01509 family)
MSLTAAIIDMDGLLFDTERVYMQATALALQDIGYDASLDLCRSLAGHPSEVCDLLILKHFGASFPFSDLAKAYEYRKQACLRSGIPLKPGAMEFLSFLQSAGFSVALATGANRATTSFYLEDCQITTYFDAIVTRDDVVHGKPAPDTYLSAVDQLGVEYLRCLAFEDSKPGVESARTAGIPVILVPDLAIVPNNTTGIQAVVPDLCAAVQYLRMKI